MSPSWSPVIAINEDYFMDTLTKLHYLQSNVF
jgi:hypothetical protein